jgi:hypothetical protein
MPIKLLEETNGDANIAEMEDGDIAIITKWDNPHDHCGEIVQRYKDDLISLGEPWGQSWSPFFTHTIPIACRVRILPKGTTFILE